MNLKGKVSLITGGSGGVGSASARQLAGFGSDVMITVRRISGRAEAMKDEIESLGRRCFPCEAEMSDPERAFRPGHETVAQLGGIIVLVHAAGV